MKILHEIGPELDFHRPAYFLYSIKSWAGKFIGLSQLLNDRSSFLKYFIHETNLFASLPAIHKSMQSGVHSILF